MAGDIGPVIALQPHNDDLERLRRLEVAQTGTKRRKLPNTRQRLKDDGLRLTAADTLLGRPDGPEMRKLELSNEEYKREAERYIESLGQNQAQWQKETREVIQDILALTDNAAELYEPYIEYPFNENFKEYGEDKEKAAKRRDYTLSLINQAISLYYWSNLQKLDDLKVTNKPEFKELQQFLYTLKTKISERAALEKDATEFETQTRLATSQIGHSQKREEESTDHSTEIQDWSDRQKGIDLARRLWRAGTAENYSKQAEERAAELEKVLAYVEKCRQETEGKIKVYTSQAKKRESAEADSDARQKAVNTLQQASQVRAKEHEDTMALTLDRSAKAPITDTTYKDIMDKIVEHENNENKAKSSKKPKTDPLDEFDIIDSSSSYDQNMAMGYATIDAAIFAGTKGKAKETDEDKAKKVATLPERLDRETKRANERAEAAATRAREAITRAEAAATRAREAEIRAKIAKAYKDDDISYEKAKDVAIHARKIEKLERQAAQNALLAHVNEKKVESMFKLLNTRFKDKKKMIKPSSGLASMATSVSHETPTEEEEEEAQKNQFKRNMERQQAQKVDIETAEKAKNSALASVAQATEAEQEALKNIANELTLEVTALRNEHDNAQAITALATQDVTALENLVDQQKTLEETLRGKPAAGHALAVPGLIERERDASRAMDAIQVALNAKKGTDIGGLKTTERNSRADAHRRRSAFQAALTNVRDTESIVVEALRRNAIHMEQEEVIGVADQAIERFQKIKDNFSDRDDKGLENRSGGHIYIDPKVGKFMINGVWTNVREVDRWDIEAGRGYTIVEFRPDIVKIEVETITREAQGGKLSVEPLYTKRLEDRYFRSENCEYHIKIEGQSYAHGGRRIGTVTYIESKKKDGTYKKPLDKQGEAASKLAEKAYMDRQPSSEQQTDADKLRANAQATRLGTYAMAAILAYNKEGPNAATELLNTSNKILNKTETEISEIIPEGSSEHNLVQLIKTFGADQAAKLLNTAAGWIEDEYTKIHTFDMEAAQTLKIKENHNNQSYPVETIFSTVVDTMPDPAIYHDQALESKQGPGWSDEDKRQMCKLDLERGVLILPNGLEYRIKDFDWTETKWDEDNGLTLQFKGPKKLSQLNLVQAGSFDNFDPRLLDTITAAKQRKRQHSEDGIELAKQAIRSYDEGKINDVLGLLQSFEGTEAYISSMAKQELEFPPEGRLDQERLKAKKKAQQDALTPEWVAKSLQNTAAIVGARQDYEDEIKKRIRAIHKKNPLSAKDVLLSHAKPEKDALGEHASSKKKQQLLDETKKKKQELLDEIRAAEHLDKTVSFELLLNPELGRSRPERPEREKKPAVPGKRTVPEEPAPEPQPEVPGIPRKSAHTGSEVKNSAPNGLELLQEYNFYKSKQDFASEAERAHVAEYVESIATEFRTNPDIDPYYSNQWNLEQALAAANDGNFLSKVNGQQIVGASEYIRNLKQVDRPPTSYDNLAGLRQAAEYNWVTNLRNALAEANREGRADLLQQALAVANWTQESRSRNLKLAESTLDLRTLSEEANKILDDMHTVETPLLWPKEDEKATVDKGQKPESKFDPKVITKKSDGELALEAGETAGQIYENSMKLVHTLIDAESNPVIQRRYRDEATKLVMELSKEAFQINKQDKEIQNQWLKLEEYVKQMNNQRWKDWSYQMAIYAMQPGPRAASDAAKKFLDEILKIMGKAAS